MENQFKIKIAVVDDEEIVCKRLKKVLEKEGYEVETFLDGETALGKISSHQFHLVILDLKLPKLDGLQVLEQIKAVSPETEVIMITAYGSIESAIEATKMGAFHYITKPIKLDEFRTLVHKAKEKIFLVSENKQLKETLARYTFTELVGKSLKMQKIYQLIIKVAPIDCNVLIQGETGTGKELVAKAIHYR
ncbi:MAG: response regulator, partial [Candidatus Desulfofervidus auxilii]|nr:response regulator [Candidatus Desulfofervidus auxilii]